MFDGIPPTYCKKDLIIRHFQEAYPEGSVSRHVTRNFFAMKGGMGLIGPLYTMYSITRNPEKPLAT